VVVTIGKVFCSLGNQFSIAVTVILVMCYIYRAVNIVYGD